MAGICGERSSKRASDLISYGQDFRFIIIDDLDLGRYIGKMYLSEYHLAKYSHLVGMLAWRVHVATHDIELDTFKCVLRVHNIIKQLNEIEEWYLRKQEEFLISPYDAQRVDSHRATIIPQLRGLSAPKVCESLKDRQEKNFEKTTGRYKMFFATQMAINYLNGTFEKTTRKCRIAEEAIEGRKKGRYFLVSNLVNRSFNFDIQPNDNADVDGRCKQFFDQFAITLAEIHESIFTLPDC